MLIFMVITILSPVTIVYKIRFSTDKFDIDKMKEASKLFLGLHDFRTFMGRGSHQPDKVTRRTLDRLDISEGSPACYSPYSWPFCASTENMDYKFLDIYMKASGFLYNQVSFSVKVS